MKQLFIFIFLILSIHALAQKSKIPLPPGCRHLYNNIFIDETEVANIHWLEFLFYAREDSTYDYFLKNLPDTTIQLKEFIISDSSDLPYYENYLRYPAFRYHPVGGITYDQALNYSKWRSSVVTRNIYMLKQMKKKDPQPDSIWYYNYRLPTEKEWEYASSGGNNLDSLPYGFKNFYKKQLFKEAKYNYALTDSSITFKEFKRIHKRYKNANTAPSLVAIIPPIEGLPKIYYSGIVQEYRPETPVWIYESPPNKFGLYNMIGNVSEMIEEKGISKGGNYLLNLVDCKIKNRQNYDAPHSWLGFRNICEVYKIPNPFKSIAP